MVIFVRIKSTLRRMVDEGTVQVDLASHLACHSSLCSGFEELHCMLVPVGTTFPPICSNRKAFVSPLSRIPIHPLRIEFKNQECGNYLFTSPSYLI